MPRLLVLLLAALACLSGGVVGAAPAQAHAGLAATEPTTGARLAQAPPRVRLTFTEEIDQRFATVRVTHDGAAVTTTTVVAGRTVTASLPVERQGGSYQVAYRVVSEDGHPVQGSYAFTALAGSATAPTTAPTTGPATTPTTAPAATDAASGPTATAAGPTALPTRDLQGSGIASAVGWVIGALVLVVVGVLVTVALAAVRQRRDGSL